MALVLDRTHRARILHRDLKPENLFVTQRDDGSLRIKLLDFGIAKVITSTTRAKTTRNIGTPLCMSPEQMRGDGDIGPRSDLYSLRHVEAEVVAMGVRITTGDGSTGTTESPSGYPSAAIAYVDQVTLVMP